MYFSSNSIYFSFLHELYTVNKIELNHHVLQAVVITRKLPTQHSCNQMSLQPGISHFHAFSYECKATQSIRLLSGY